MAAESEGAVSDVRDFKEGTYYPAASLYTLPEQAEGATVAFNFGAPLLHVISSTELLFTSFISMTTAFLACYESAS